MELAALEGTNEAAIQTILIGKFQTEPEVEDNFL
jgi:hypothetical protein